MVVDKKCPICKKRNMIYRSLTFTNDCKEIKLEIVCNDCNYSQQLSYSVTNIQGKLF